MTASPAGDGGVRITREDPRRDLFAGLFQSHAAAMAEDAAAGVGFSQDAAALVAAGVDFLVLWDGNVPVGMAALKRIGANHAEIKSMHVLPGWRGRGLARGLLDHVLAMAESAGFGRISLETGSAAAYAPARRLYAGAGFADCPPFADYPDDPACVFMTLTLG